MIISDEQLQKFKKICKEQMGVEIDNEKARDQAGKLLRLITLTRGPVETGLEADDAIMLHGAGY